MKTAVVQQFDQPLAVQDVPKHKPGPEQVPASGSVAEEPGVVAR